MFAASLKAFNLLFAPAFRTILFKSLGITVALLVLAVTALTTLFGALAALPGWVETIIQIVGGLGLVIASVFLIAPISALIAGLYIDDIAEHVEETHYPNDEPGRELGIAEGLGTSLKFGLVVVLVNVGVLFLLLIPGVNVMAFYLGNGYLLGREFFEMAAMRYMRPAEARALRRDNRIRVFLSGIGIAGMASVPFLNLLTPLFAAAFMVHTVKDVMRTSRRPQAARVPEVDSR